MTNRPRSKRWSYSAGERGRNRTRVFEHSRNGALYLEWYEAVPNGRPKVSRLPLPHRDRALAKAAADELAARLARAMPAVPAVPSRITLGALIDNYLVERTRDKSPAKQAHDRRCAVLFGRAFGRDTDPRTLSRREWDRFIRDRQAGALAISPEDAEKKPAKRIVRPRAVAYDLAWIVAVFNWATLVSDGRGGVLLAHNPFKGFPMPREENPRRPRLTPEEYGKLVEVAPQVSRSFGLALTLTHETGHRIGAVRLLRWSDVDLTAKTVRWRAENDKIGMEHTTPLTDDAVTALEAARLAQSAIGDAWVFAAPGDASEPCSRHLMRDWWERGALAAKLEPAARRGWHSLRRQFATELKDTPLKDLCALGGWKDPQTVLTCYQQADDETMRNALAQRRAIRASGAGGV